MDVGLFVGRSWLSLPDNEFNGLFTRVSRNAGEVVCVYEGTVIRTAEALKIQDKSYLMRIGEQCYIDARLPYKREEEPEGSQRECIARYINDSINPAGYNVRFDKEPDNLPYARALVVALRDIEPGEELFVCYGKRYWEGSDLRSFRIPFMQLHLARTAAIEAAKLVQEPESREEEEEKKEDRASVSTTLNQS
jgi:SET domain-containing protein